MNTIVTTLNEIQFKTFDIGFVGEKNHTQILINCSTIFRKYQNAVATMAVRPPTGDIYPVSLNYDGVFVIWNISEGDVAHAGAGQFQLTFTDGDGDSAEIIKTVYGSYSVKESMVVSGDPPEPIENWLEEATTTLAELKSFENVIITESNPSINGESNKRYVCGEVASISISAPQTGMIDITFVSGNTATILTTTGIEFPAWFDGMLEANTRYEINVLDGYGVITAWQTT